MTNIPDRDGDSRLASATAQVRDAAGHAKEVAGEALGTAVERVSGVVATAKDSAGVAYSTTREKASETFAAAGKRASEVYAAAREQAAAAGKATSEGVQDFPAVALIGAIAAGAVAAALIPRSTREAAIFAPVGARIGDVVKLAVASAKEAGIDALGESGLNRDAARSQIDKLLDVVVGAAKAAGGAAAEAVKKQA